jgi:hypothetical protein
MVTDSVYYDIVIDIDLKEVWTSNKVSDSTEDPRLTQENALRLWHDQTLGQGDNSERSE